MSTTKQVSAIELPIFDSIAAGVVIATLCEESFDSLPHALFVKFHGHLGIVKIEDLDTNCTERLKSVLQNDEILNFVTRTTADGKTHFEISKLLLSLIELAEPSAADAIMKSLCKFERMIKLPRLSGETMVLGSNTLTLSSMMWMDQVV